MTKKPKLTIDEMRLLSCAAAEFSSFLMDQLHSGEYIQQTYPTWKHKSITTETMLNEARRKLDILIESSTKNTGPKKGKVPQDLVIGAVEFLDDDQFKALQASDPKQAPTLHEFIEKNRIPPKDVQRAGHWTDW